MKSICFGSMLAILLAGCSASSEPLAEVKDAETPITPIVVMPRVEVLASAKDEALPSVAVARAPAGWDMEQAKGEARVKHDGLTGEPIVVLPRVTLRPRTGPLAAL